MVVVVAIIVLIPFTMRWRAQARLNAYRKQLIAKGEKLNIEEFVSKPSGDSTNTGEFLTLLASIWNWDPIPHGMHVIKPGVARVAWKEEECMEESPGPGPKPPTNVWPGFVKKVKAQGMTPNRVGQLAAGGGVHFMGDVMPQDQASPNQPLLQLFERERSGPGSLRDGAAESPSREQ